LGDGHDAAWSVEPLAQRALWHFVFIGQRPAVGETAGRKD